MAARALRLLLPAGLLIGLLGSLLGPPLVRHVYGAAFAPTGTALAVLAWAVALACPTSILACALQAARRTGLLALLVAVALAANVALNLVLIPRLSLLGPCLATVAGEALLLVLLIIAAGRFATGATAGGTLPRLLLGTAGGAGAAEALVAAGPLCQAALGTTVFLSLLALTGYIDPREWAHLRAYAPWRQGTIRD